MSTAHAVQDGRSGRDARRKRKQGAKAAAPEPKYAVSGAGQPLDLSVRRDMEERLGHDLSRVRLHTDRDAAALTGLLGADAVAVGQDIFFGEGAYRPGAVDGRRLLAHELLHTVQAPHGLGTLTAGRDDGAVSLPQQAAERTAEATAESVVDEAEPTAAELEVEPEQTPGWLRYATVDADLSRTELDPATLPDRLAGNIVRTLRGDPLDQSKRTRKQLARLPDELVEPILHRLESRLLSPEYERVLGFLDEIETEGNLERGSLDAPVAEPDAAAELRLERETERRVAEEERNREQRPAPAPGPEKEQSGAPGATGSTPQNGGARENGAPQQGASAPRGASTPPEPAAPATPITAEPASQGPTDERQEAGQQTADAGEQTAEETDQQGAPVPSKEESAAKNRPGAVDPLVAGQQLKPQDKAGREQPTGSPTMSGKDTQSFGAASTLDGVRNQDLDAPEDTTREEPLATGGESEVDVGGEERSAWDIKLQPEDFLPAQDLDVSGVPTADTLDPSSAAAPALPSFPAPPPTKADQVQAERDAEDAEDAAAEAEEDTTETEAPPAEMEEAESGGEQPEELAMEQAAEAPPGPGPTPRDPTSGDDPKAGPVAAQTTVQMAAGTSEGGGKETEQAAKEEKGTPAAGDTTTAAPEKASQQAVGGQSAPPDPAAKETQKTTDATAAGKSEPTADAAAPSPARDSHVSGGSNADTPGGASGNAVGGAQSTPPMPSEAQEPELAPAVKSAPTSRSAAPPSAPTAQRSRGGGGGGGTAAVPAKGKKDSGPAPNLSTVSPEAGLTTASKLKPHKALEAMTGVSGSVDRTVGDEHKSLAAAPPSMTRPAGAPRTLHGKPKTDAPARYSRDPASKSDPPEQEKAEVTGAKQPEGPIEAEKAEEPGGWDTFKMALGFGVGKVLGWLGFKVDATELAAKFAGLPTKDEALKQAQAGNAPGVQMQDAAEQTAGEQGSSVDAKGQDTVATGRDDAGRGMGEDQVYPDAPKEQMKAKVPGQDGGKGAAPQAGAGTGAVPPEAASAVAEHDRDPQFQASFRQGQKGMSEGRQAKDRDFRDSQAKHKVKVNLEIATNTKSQKHERDKALGDVTEQRTRWRKDQDAELKKLGTKKTDRHEKIRTDVKDKEKKTDDDVANKKKDGDKKIQDKNTEAEKDAEKKRDDSVKDSGNWISKAFEWIKNKVIEIKNAIVRIIKAARDAVVGFIKDFKETVERWINETRKAIVDAIKDFINDLIEFAKAMVQAVIELANSIRNLITSLIAAAIAFVNKLANALKQIIKDLLDAIGKLLSDILNILLKALQDVIKAVVDAIKQILAYATQLLGMLGAFLFIAIDFLSDPGGWLSGAKNSAVDGAKHHLFREVQAAVKQWFQSKIQEIIGVPKAIIERLIKGGFTLDKIVKETWDAVVPMLPFIIGEIVITKVIAKLIPGAGWVMAVIDAIRTAIGALGEILRAMGAVLSWLRAVRSGGAGILFAKAVAAGIVALLELAYQALLNGIGKYVAKVGKRLRGIAAKLGRRRPGRRGEPDTPRRPADEAADGKPATKRPDEEVPTALPALPSPSGREPGPTRTKAELETTPGTRKPEPPVPGKPRTTPADRKKPEPTSKDKNGRPKTPESDKPDTRPTPAPKPKPKAEPKPKPGPEPTPRPKDETPGKPPEKDSTKPKDDAPTPPKPKDGEDTGQAKQRGKDDGSTRPKDDDKSSDKPKGINPKRPTGDKDGTKPTRPKEGDDKKPKPRKDGNKPSSRKPDKDGDAPGRPKSPKGKDDREKDESSSSAKEARLAMIAARIREILKEPLGKGIKFSSHRTLLASLRRHYRLSSLRKEGSAQFTVVARLNPAVPVIPGYSTYETEIDHRKPDPTLPRPKAPSKQNNVLATNFTAEAINEPWADKRGEPAEKARKDEPIGFRYINKYDLNRDASNYWVRQHLLTCLLGGTADGRNLIPARNRVNQSFKNEVEKPAERWIRSGQNKIAWYDVKVNYHAGVPRGFPSFLRTSWGAYYPDYTNNKWIEEKRARDYNERSDLEIPPGPGDIVYVNYDSAVRMQNMLNIPQGISEDIEDVAEVHSRNISSMSILLEDLKTLRVLKRRRKKGWDIQIRKLIRAAAEGRLVFEKKP